MNDVITYVSGQMRPEVPVILGLIGCIVAAFVFRQRAPSASLYAASACGLKLVLQVMYPVLSWYVMALGVGGNPIIRTIWTFAWSIADALCTILLVFAVFVGRTQPNQALQATAAAPSS
jgi:hypothetical protein